MVKDANQMIAEVGKRSTSARLAVLNVLNAAEGALSHAEIIERMSTGYQFDRVTIYRVLDWLTEYHLIHRIASDDRAWKFQVSLPNASHQHAHLLCTSCGKISCIHELSPHFPKPLLEKYHVETIDVHFKGLCEDCFSSSP